MPAKNKKMKGKKRMKKKLLSLLLAFAMVISLAACEKKPAMGKDATATEPVVIVHTNDVHGAVEGYAKVGPGRPSTPPRARMCLCWTPATSARATPPSTCLRALRPSR